MTTRYDWPYLARQDVGASAYDETIPGVAADPPGGWQQIAAFVCPNAHPSIKLRAMVIVTQVALECRVRLWDTFGPGSPVAGSTLSILGADSLLDQEKVTNDLSSAMVTGRSYFIEAECIGGALPTDYAIVRHAIVEGF